MKKIARYIGIVLGLISLGISALRAEIADVNLIMFPGTNSMSLNTNQWYRLPNPWGNMDSYISVGQSVYIYSQNTLVNGNVVASVPGHMMVNQITYVQYSDNATIAAQGFDQFLSWEYYKWSAQGAVGTKMVAEYLNNNLISGTNGAVNNMGALSSTMTPYIGTVTNTTAVYAGLTKYTQIVETNTKDYIFLGQKYPNVNIVVTFTGHATDGSTAVLKTVTLSRTEPTIVQFDLNTWPGKKYWLSVSNTQTQL